MPSTDMRRVSTCRGGGAAFFLAAGLARGFLFVARTCSPLDVATQPRRSHGRRKVPEPPRFFMSLQYLPVRQKGRVPGTYRHVPHSVAVQPGHTPHRLRFIDAAVGGGRSVPPKSPVVGDNCDDPETRKPVQVVYRLCAESARSDDARGNLKLREAGAVDSVTSILSSSKRPQTATRPRGRSVW